MDFVKVLKEINLTPSFQRIKILEYLYDHKTHPTADMIYQALVREMPTLSKTTVYNTLKTFIKEKIIVSYTLFENEVRYDFKTTPHFHFICTVCGEIYDIDKSHELYQKKNIDGHKILDCQVNMKGVCKKCREENRSFSNK